MPLEGGIRHGIIPLDHSSEKIIDFSGCVFVFHLYFLSLTGFSDSSKTKVVVDNCICFMDLEILMRVGSFYFMKQHKKNAVVKQDREAALRKATEAFSKLNFEGFWKRVDQETSIHVAANAKARALSLVTANQTVCW